MNSPAKIFYLIGASGAGKDTILNAYKKSAVNEKEKIVVAHRYITRVNAVVAQGENFISLSDAEFALRDSHRLFALSWQANNCCYGIGVELDACLNSGLSIIVNGSRSYLPTAQEKYPKNLVAITVDVPEDMLRKRLVYRQRESLQEIDARIDRHRQLKGEHKADEVIMNATTINDAVDSFSAIIKKYEKIELA